MFRSAIHHNLFISKYKQWCDELRMERQIIFLLYGSFMKEKKEFGLEDNVKEEIQLVTKI